MKIKNRIIFIGLIIAVSTVSQAKLDKKNVYYNSEVRKEINDNTFIKFTDSDDVEEDVLKLSGENQKTAEFKMENNISFERDNYSIVANNMDYLDEDYIISSKVFQLTDINDSFEPFNRRMYAFNTQLDNKVAYPASRVYGAIVPRPVRTGISNFFGNFKEIPTFVNSILQLKPKKAVNALGRFTVNSTVGILGITDPASKMGLKKDHETMGDTLGVYGVGPGSYLVIPITGPSTIRDGIGSLADNAMEGAVRGVVEEELFFDPGVFDKTVYGFTRPVVTGLNARSLINFRYGDLNSPFEYDLVRAFYYNFRKIQIKK